MADLPSKSSLREALATAVLLHDDYERTILKGVVDERWAGFCAAYLIGRLGDFAPPGRVAGLLEQVADQDDWPAVAAAHLLTKLRS
jgi:hypothetical protein